MAGVHVEVPSLGPYFGGNVITGDVVVNVGQPEEHKGVYVQLTGTDNVSWTEARPQAHHGDGAHSHHGHSHHGHRGHGHGHGHHGHHHGHHGDSHENAVTLCDVSDSSSILETKVCVLGGGILQPGQHRFPFQIQLPPHLASSLCLHLPSTGAHGHYHNVEASISYGLRAWVSKPIFRFDHNSSVLGLTVAEGIPPPAPVVGHNQKFFFFAKGDLILDAYISANSYFPGEQVYVRVSVNNQSTKDVTGIVVSLHKTTKLAAHNSSGPCYEDTVSEQRFMGLPSHHAMTRDLSILLPPDAAPSANTRHINVEYSLAIKCQVSGVGSSLCLSLPVSLCVPQQRSIPLPSGASAAVANFPIFPSEPSRLGAGRTTAAEETNGVVVVEVFQNERKSMFGKWSAKNNLPTDRGVWSTINGKPHPGPSEYELPAGWVWIEPKWTADTSDTRPTIGPDGWEYAFNWPHKFHPQPSKVHFVRRKRWYRTRRRQDVPVPPTPAAPSTAAAASANVNTGSAPVAGPPSAPPPADSYADLNHQVSAASPALGPANPAGQGGLPDEKNMFTIE